MAEERDDRPLIYKALKKMNLLAFKDDFYDVGLVGLARGIKNYDESKGFERSTFYMKCIINEITKEIVRLRAKKNAGMFMEVSLNKMLGEDSYGETELGTLIADPEVDVEESAINNTVMEEVYRLIDKCLTGEQRKYINDYYFKGIKASKMAEERGISVQSVYNHIREAVDVLRNKINKSHYDSSKIKILNRDLSLEEMLKAYM